MRISAAIPLSLAAAACAPMMEIRDGAQADRLREMVTNFCETTASGDVSRVADLFGADIKSAIETAVQAGHPPAFASRAGATGCRPGRVWYVGGSRRVLEVQYDGFADRLDMWLADDGKLSDLHYATGEPRLSARVGLPTNTSRVF